jgi:hypothetical protein
MGYSLVFPPGWIPGDLVGEEALEMMLMEHASALRGAVPIAEADREDENARLLAILLDDELPATGVYPTILVERSPVLRAW